MLQSNPRWFCALATLWMATAFWRVGPAGASQMYWSDTTVDVIRHAELDGSGVGIVAAGISSLGVAVDVANGKLYWTTSSQVPGVAGTIQRSNLDGSGREVLADGADGVSGPADLQLDLSAGKVYWTDIGLPGGRIMRANLDGSAVETVFSAPAHRGPDFGTGPGQTLEFASVWGLALDPAAGVMYWTDFFGGDIHRANLDGTGVSGPLVTGLGQPRGLVIDHAAGQMIWTEQLNSTISRAALDGSGVQLILDDLDGVDEAFGLAIDPIPGKLYWTNMKSGEIRRADLDGQNAQSLLLFPGQDLVAIALAPTTPPVPSISFAGLGFLAAIGLLLGSRAIHSGRMLPRPAPAA